MRTLWKAALAELQRRLPVHLREPRSVYLVLVLVLGELSALVSVFLQRQGPEVWLGLAFCGLIGLLVLFFFRGMAMPKVVYAAASLGASYLFFVSLHEGGIYTSTLAWLPLLPLGIFYVIAPQAGRQWMLLAAFLLVLMAVVTWAFGDSLPPFEVPNLPAMSYVDYLLASVALYMVPHFYQKEFEDNLAEGQMRQKELEARQQELEHAAQMREHFIAMVSHELRTPMNAILGLNTLLLERVGDKPQALRVLEYTRQSADHLMTVINDVLDYSQFSSGQLGARVECFALHQTVRTAFELFLPRIENTRLDYVCEIGPDVPEWVQTDKHRLMQVLVNLLGNAVKFTHQGRVSLQVKGHDGGVYFEVQDTGIGIALPQQQKVFERFGQANAGIHHRYGGSGLGLTISQRLVLMLGGRMGLESQEGLGSKFWFWLPLQAQDVPPRAEQAHRVMPSNAHRSQKFLVVDDHPVNRMLARQALLRQWPNSLVHECEDGENAVRALEAAGEVGYNLVLMDMVMPLMDGIEATQRIRDSAQPKVRSTPVLGLTANVSAQDLARFEQAGLNGLLLKPFDLERLCDEVARLVQAPS